MDSGGKGNKDQWDEVKEKVSKSIDSFKMETEKTTQVVKEKWNTTVDKIDHELDLLKLKTGQACALAIHEVIVTKDKWNETKGKLSHDVDETSDKLNHELDLVKLKAAQKAAISIDNSATKIQHAKVYVSEATMKTKEYFDHISEVTPARSRAGSSVSDDGTKK
jgi:hypothetical protein